MIVFFSSSCEVTEIIFYKYQKFVVSNNSAHDITILSFKDKIQLDSIPIPCQDSFVKYTDNYDYRSNSTVFKHMNVDSVRIFNTEGKSITLYCDGDPIWGAVMDCPHLENTLVSMPFSEQKIMKRQEYRYIEFKYSYVFSDSHFQ
jgi:hypothetical protein